MTLKEYLALPDVSAAKVAEELGVTQVTVNRYANGRRFPDKQTILKIDEITGQKVQPADWYRVETAA